MSAPSEKPAEPANWSSDYFRDAAAQGQLRMDQGLIGHVPIIAALLIVQGGLELLFALFCYAFIALVYWGPEKELSGMHGVAVLFAFVSVPSLVSGVLRIVAGCFNVRYRRRGLGMTALCLGLATMVTGYCAPTSIALAVYGLIVYVNESVTAAFAMGDRGRSVGEIRGAFLPRQ
jgi:hypothetical protein